MLQITISKRAALMIGVALILVIPGIAGATHVFSDVTDGHQPMPRALNMSLAWESPPVAATGRSTVRMMP